MVTSFVLLVVVCFGLGQETITLLKFTDHTFFEVQKYGFIFGLVKNMNATDSAIITFQPKVPNEIYKCKQSTIAVMNAATPPKHVPCH